MLVSPKEDQAPAVYDLEKWKRGRTAHLADREQRRRRFAVADMSEEDSLLGPVRVFTTEHERWRVSATLTADPQPAITTPDLYWTVVNTLGLRQHFRPASQEAERRHEENVDFLASNWFQVLDLISPMDGGEFEPICFTEVGLKIDYGAGKKRNYGQADIVGIGASGAIFVIEVGSSVKADQARRYIEGLRDLFEDTVSIGGLTAVYHSVTDEVRNIHLQGIPKDVMNKVPLASGGLLQQ